MNTHSHAFFTYAMLHQRSDVGLAVAGSVFPDALYYLAVPAIALFKGIGIREAQTEVYRIPALRRTVDAVHSIPVALMVAALLALLRPEWLMFCYGWMSHLLIDFVTHSKGAHPHFWPLFRWRFASPISFYEPDRHGYRFMIVEHALIAGLTAYWISQGHLNPDRLLGILHDGGAIALSAFAGLSALAYLSKLRQRRRLQAA